MIIRSVLLAAWFLAFAFLLFCVSRSASALSKKADAIHEQSQWLKDNSRELTDISRRIRARGKEMEALLKIVSLVPEDRGFLRTQKVVLDEVLALRRKAKPWIGSENIHIIVDTKINKFYLKKGQELLMEADCSVGRGGILKDKATGRAWEFVTPLGEFSIQKKIENPVWIKPDWAFVESQEPIPPPGDPLRRVEGELGAYVLSLGNGYLIHGTKYEKFLGTAVSHGCVRLGAEDLKKLYETAPVETRVYIY